MFENVKKNAHPSRSSITLFPHPNKSNILDRPLKDVQLAFDIRQVKHH